MQPKREVKRRQVKRKITQARRTVMKPKAFPFIHIPLFKNRVVSMEAYTV
jgi:hypothetical protein